MDKEASTQRWYENFVYVLCIVFFSFLEKTAFSTKSRALDGMQSMTFPKFIFAFIILLCSIKLIGNVLHMVKNKEYAYESLNGKVIASLLFIIVYAGLWQVLGFGLSSVLFVSLESFILRPQTKVWKSIIVAIGSTLVLYFVFGYLFKVSFPEPILDLIIG